MATMAAGAGSGAGERTRARARGSRRSPHLLFAAGIMAFTLAVLIGLYLAVGERAAPSAYPGLNGFPKAGVLPTKAATAVVTFLFAFIVGFLIQRSRWCNASAIRDAILFKSFRNTKPLLAAMAVITAMFTLFEVINVGQPIHIIGGMFTVLGLFLFGIGMVLGGACTVSVWVRSGEGSIAALWALIFTFVGMFFFSEVWNVLRWPPANYLQSTHPDLSVLSFGSYDAISIRSALGPTLGPVTVGLLGALQVAVLIFIYRRLLAMERRAAASAPVAAASPVTGPSTSMAPPSIAQATMRQHQAPAVGAVHAVRLPGENEQAVAQRALAGRAAGSEPISADRVLDCSGEMCPRPQLLTKRVVTKEMRVGEVLELVVDNPSSPDLVPTIMEDIGAEHVSTVRTDENWKLYIRKKRELAGAGARR